MLSGGDGGDAQEAFTGARERRGSAAEFDFRCFFLVGERSRICEKIDRRCEVMLTNGLLQETDELLRAGILVPRTTAGKSIGYRQVAQYLLAPDAEQGVEAPAIAAIASEQRFRTFLSGFCTVVRYTEASDPFYFSQAAMQVVLSLSHKILSLCVVVAIQSRQYSTEQMKWFRKDKSYLWVRSELEKSNPIADAMERITHYYRADRSTFEAALCAVANCLLCTLYARPLRTRW